MIKIYHNATNALVLGGGGNALYLAHTLNYKNPHLKSQPIVIARALPEAIHKIKSFCYFLPSQKVESPYPTNSNLQSKIPPIHSYIIYLTHCLKSFVLDTSLRNATLGMTDFHHLAHTRNIRLCERVL